MFGLGASEMVVIGIVALIVIGPKDLPGLFRTMGQFTGKARTMAREFSRAMNAAADEAGARDISKTINAAINPSKFGTDALKAAARGPATQALTDERAAQRKKLAEDMEQAAIKRRNEREAAEAAEAAAAAAGDEPPADAAPLPEDEPTKTETKE